MIHWNTLCAVALTLAAGVFPTACSDPTQARDLEEEAVVGRVTMDFAMQMALAMSDGKVPVITSAGGESVAGLAAGTILAEHDSSIIVDDYCLSSCASYVMAGANHVEFRDRAVVGFHDNAHLDYSIYAEVWPERGCYQRTYEMEREIYARNTGGERFLDELHERLAPSIISVEEVADESDLNELCMSVSYELTNQYWFPTSQQIEEFMGIEVEGDLCADDAACMRRRLRNLHLTGTVVVGDDVWTLPLD
tara:strand:- start:14511 stop:15260 length:750 start_codon:yes stop_codon:yes gene_type:complete